MQHHAYRNHLPLGMQAVVSFRGGYVTVARAGYTTTPGAGAGARPVTMTAPPATNIPSWIPMGSGADGGTTGGGDRAEREVAGGEDANGPVTRNWFNRLR